MKKMLAIASTTLVLLAANTALAAGVIYDARCFNVAEGDMDRCRISVNDEAGTLTISFNSEENSVSDLALDRRQITGISAGDFEKKPDILGIIFGEQTQSRVRFLVEYVDAQGEAQVARIDVKREFSRYLEGDLEDLIGERLSTQ